MCNFGLRSILELKHDLLNQGEQGNLFVIRGNFWFSLILQEIDEICESPLALIQVFGKPGSEVIFNFLRDKRCFIQMISTKVFANSNCTKLDTMSNHCYCEENPSPVGKLICPPICLTNYRIPHNTCLLLDLLLFWSEIDHKFSFWNRDNEI